MHISSLRFVLPQNKTNLKYNSSINHIKKLPSIAKYNQLKSTNTRTMSMVPIKSKKVELIKMKQHKNAGKKNMPLRVNCNYLATVPIDEDVTAIEISVNNTGIMCMEILQPLKYLL